ncbi:MAG: flagellin FliC [Dehalococcoidia bacterium]|nr:flagellin FliC [Dehalococcoidia bacterium]
MARINLNLDAQRALRNLGGINAKFGKSVERISSGLRINRAADDAAGLSISERLRSEIKGLNRAVLNSQDALSLLQTGEGALAEVQSILQRMRELAVQGSNDTLNSIDRGAIESELDTLKTEVDRISEATIFNSKKLLNGSNTFQFQIGTGTNTSFEVLQVNPVSTTTAIIGSGTVAGAATLSAAVVGLSSPATGGIARATFLTLIGSLDDALNDISTARSAFGAKVNRLDHTIRSLQVAAESAQASESRIRDADIAVEVSEFVAQQILQQAAISILGQANQAPALILQLLR